MVKTQKKLKHGLFGEKENKNAKDKKLSEIEKNFIKEIGDRIKQVKETKDNSFEVTRLLSYLANDYSSQDLRNKFGFKFDDHSYYNAIEHSNNNGKGSPIKESDKESFKKRYSNKRVNKSTTRKTRVKKQDIEREIGLFFNRDDVTEITSFASKDSLGDQPFRKLINGNKKFHYTAFKRILPVTLSTYYKYIPKWVTRKKTYKEKKQTLQPKESIVLLDYKQKTVDTRPCGLNIINGKKVFIIPEDEIEEEISSQKLPFNNIQSMKSTSSSEVEANQQKQQQQVDDHSMEYAEKENQDQEQSDSTTAIDYPMDINDDEVSQSMDTGDDSIPFEMVQNEFEETMQDEDMMDEQEYSMELLFKPLITSITYVSNTTCILTVNMTHSSKIMNYVNHLLMCNNRKLEFQFVLPEYTMEI